MNIRRGNTASPRYYKKNTRNYSSLIKGAVGIGLGVFALRGAYNSGLIGQAVGAIGDLSAPLLRSATGDATNTLVGRAMRDVEGVRPLVSKFINYDTNLKFLRSGIERNADLSKHTDVIMDQISRAGMHRRHPDYFALQKLSQDNLLNVDKMKDILGPKGLAGRVGPDADEFASKVLAEARGVMNRERPGVADKAAKVHGLMDRELLNIGQRETFLEKVMSKAGYTRATVRDVPGHFQGDIANRLGADAINKLKADPLLFKKGDKLMDLRPINDAVHKGLGFLDRHFGTPIVNLNPLRLLHYRNIRQVATAPKVEAFGVGTKLPFQTGTRLPIQQSRMFIGDKLIHMDTGIIERAGVHLDSARFGTRARVTPKMAGFNIEDTAPYADNILGRIGKALSIGRQDTPAVFEQWTSVAGKFKNPEWEPNVLKRILTRQMISTGAEDYGNIKLHYRQIQRLMEQRLPGVSSDTIDELKGKVDFGRVFGDVDIDFSTRDKFLSTFEALANRRHLPEGLTAAEEVIALKSDIYGKRITELWEKYNASPSSFLSRQRYATNKGAIGLVHNIDLYSEADDIQKLLTREVIHRIKQDQPGLAMSDLVTRESGRLRDLESLVRFEQLGERLNFGHLDERLNAQDAFLRMVKDGTPFGDDMQNIISRLAPKSQKFVTYDEYTERIGQGFDSAQERILVNKSYGFIESINDAIREEGFSPVTKWAKQFTAGRYNLDEVTTATFYPYFMAERLNSTLATLGLGMSREYAGSAQQMFGNLLSKRWFPVLAGGAAFTYANYEMKNFTGTNAIEIGADILAGTQSAVIGVRSLTGSPGRAKKRRQLYAGIEHLAEESPVGIPLRLMGLTGERNLAEHQEYLHSGYDPVKGGRWWRMGSKTPWYGDKVRYYQPSWYQRAHSEDPRTMQLYGSEDEYWRNHWMPTPRYPMAPVRHFLTDPYYLEKKHYWDRPYPETGSIPMFAEMPLVGPLLDSTVGTVLKPKVKMHRAELAAINRGIKQSGEEAQTFAYTSPAGMITPSQFVGDYYISDELPADGNHLYATDDGYAMTSGRGAAAYAARADLAGINQDIINSGAIRKEELPWGPFATRLGRVRMKSIDALQDLQTLEDIMSMTDPRFAAGQTFYSMTELAGIYGFMTGALSMGWASEIYQGNEMVFSGPVTERARMDTFHRRFWDMNIGGIGADISEVYRRFFPRERRVEYWNPIQNTMPDWMPGENYFINFRQGDPYIQRYPQLLNGEARMPGAGYESINQLNPDMFGEYGAFDRFKILADVAPYSEEYRYWRDMATRTIEDPELRDEMVVIKDQVSQRKKKYDFKPYRFKYADIDEQTVTVTEMLDSGTFLTQEFPENPIRLAGIRLTDDDADQVGRFISPGSRVKIGYAADDLNMIANDQLDTIRATVWSGGTNVNQALLRAGAGTEQDDDYSPAGVHARFSDWEMTKGRAWERFAHLDTMFHTRFLQVRSPLETYERKEVYGKAFQKWWPPTQQLIPTFESFISKGIIPGTVLGAMGGMLFGQTFTGMQIGAAIGAATSFVGSTYVKGAGAISKMTTGQDWIPKRRRIERNIDEYFDILEYLKYRRLFEQANRLAVFNEGMDVAEFITHTQDDGSIVKRERGQLRALKKAGILAGSADREDIGEINDTLRFLNEQRDISELGPYSLLALQYHAKYTSTLYGADPFGPWTNLMSALPAKDRPFMGEFMKASPKERERILEIIPRNQRRFYQAKWGKKLDDLPTLDSYFGNRYLPDAGWAGWRADVDLEHIKYKVVKNEGLDITEFGMWDDTAKAARMLTLDAPNINRKNRSLSSIRGELNKILRGMGMQDIMIEVLEADIPGVTMNVDISDEMYARFQSALRSDTQLFNR